MDDFEWIVHWSWSQSEAQGKWPVSFREEFRFEFSLSPKRTKYSSRVFSDFDTRKPFFFGNISETMNSLFIEWLQKRTFRPRITSLTGLLHFLICRTHVREYFTTPEEVTHPCHRTPARTVLLACNWAGRMHSLHDRFAALTVFCRVWAKPVL